MFKLFRRVPVSSKKLVLVSSYLSSRLSVLMYQRGSNCPIFLKFDTGDFHDDVSRKSRFD